MPQDSDIITRIADQCIIKRIRLSEFFQDFDHLRHGECHSCHVTTALSMLSLELTEAEYGLLCRIYASSVPDQFCYREFLGDIEQILRKGIFPDSAHASTSPRGIRTSTPRPKQVQSDLSCVLRRIQSAVDSNHVSLRTYLHDFDHLRKGCVTRSALSCVLTVLKVPICSSDLDTIVHSYGSLDGWRMDYRNLCRDLEASSSEHREKPHSNDFSPPQYTHPLTVLEARLQRRTRIRGIRLLSHFRNYDKHNRWFISGDQFHRVMTTLGYVLDKDELRLLCSKYCNDPLNEHFAYPDFVKQMERDI